MSEFDADAYPSEIDLPTRDATISLPLDGDQTVWRIDGHKQGVPNLHLNPECPYGTDANSPFESVALAMYPRAFRSWCSYCVPSLIRDHDAEVVLDVR